jgi:hypothetical protein
MLRDTPLLSDDALSSDTLYFRGFPRSESESSVLTLLAIVSSPVTTDLSHREKSGQVWAKYASSDIACGTILKLHNMNVNGSVLSVKYELGVDEAGKRRVDRSSHSTVIRTICKRKNGLTGSDSKTSICQSCSGLSASIPCSCGSAAVASKKRMLTGSSSANNNTGVSYTSNSLFVGELEYPFPFGLYLTRVVELSRRIPAGSAGTVDPLLAILTDTYSMGNKYGKEISEAMAMADAVQRAASLLPASLRTALRSDASAEAGRSAVSTDSGGVPHRVVVYVLGDGCRPLTAACLCLQLPPHVVFHSIDPLMQESYLSAYPATDTESASAGSNPVFGAYSHRFFPARMYSQDFQIPPPSLVYTTAGSSTLSIVVSCHSHAPPQEFWDRVPVPRIAVTMACCAGFADLTTAPTMVFEDFEVYSPKRTVKICMDL